MRRLSIDTIRLIKDMRLKGFSIWDIAERMGASHTTIQRHSGHILSVSSKQRAGAPIKVFIKLKKLIVRFFDNGIFHNTVEAAKYLHDIHGVNVSRYTISSILRRSGFKSMAKPLKPRLLPHHKKARRVFARLMKNVSLDDWKRVVFTDESKYNLYGPDGNVRVWRRPKEELRDHHVRSVVKFGGGGVMVWGAISYNGVGKLKFIEGKMDSAQYISIFKSGYAGTLKMHDITLGESILQQDNDPKHTSRVTQMWMQSVGLRVLPWPSCSSDMNPIEHVWDHVDARIRAEECQPKNIEELKALLKEKWKSTPLAYIQSLYDGMPRRIEALRRAKGGNTKY